MKYLTVLVSVVILAGSYILVQTNKQDAIDKKANEARQQEVANSFLLQECIGEAEDAYWSHVELNGTGNRHDDEGVKANVQVWKTAEANKQNKINNCIKQYK